MLIIEPTELPQFGHAVLTPSSAVGMRFARVDAVKDGAAAQRKSTAQRTVHEGRDG